MATTEHVEQLPIKTCPACNGTGVDNTIDPGKRFQPYACPRCSGTGAIRRGN